IQVPRLKREHGAPYDSLASRNLIRAGQLQLPAGQDIADSLLGAAHSRTLCKAIGFDTAYAAQTAAALLPENNAVIRAAGADVGTLTPLWYYLLQESWAHERGIRLGKLGSLIIADTLRGLVRTSAVSIHDRARRLAPWIAPTGADRTLRISDLLYAV